MSKYAAQATAIVFAFSFPASFCASREEWLGTAGWLCASVATVCCMAAWNALDRVKVLRAELIEEAIAEGTRSISAAYEAHIRQLRQEQRRELRS